jgi:undecaprenyl-diphosphatase
MRSKRFIAAYFLFFALAIFLSLRFDVEISRFASTLRNQFLANILLGVAFTSSEIIIFFLLTSLFLSNERKRKWIFPLWLTLFLATIISYGLKIIVQRARPFQEGVVTQLMNGETFSAWNSSFPSYQAMMVFSAIPLLSREFKRGKYIWIAFACLVAFSRLYFGVHYPSDILIGGLMGYLLGWIIVQSERKNRTWSRLYERIKDKVSGSF